MLGEYLTMGGTIINVRTVIFQAVVVPTDGFGIKIHIQATMVTTKQNCGGIMRPERFIFKSTRIGRHVDNSNLLETIVDGWVLVVTPVDKDEQVLLCSDFGRSVVPEVTVQLNEKPSPEVTFAVKAVGGCLFIPKKFLKALFGAREAG